MKRKTVVKKETIEEEKEVTKEVTLYFAKVFTKREF